jgi:hypothetical protein
MLNSLDKQGSAVRYSKSLDSFDKALENPQHKQGPRELETGVTHTADNKGETSFKNLRAKTHVLALRLEALARQLGTEEEVGKLGFKLLRQKIKEHIRGQWIVENPGEAIPDDVRKSFLPWSTGDFSCVY